MKKFSLLIVLTILLSLILPGTAYAQSYYFAVDSAVVDVFYNDDGSMDVVYVYTFSNQPGAHVIDYVDIGLPNSNFELSNISAELDGNPLSDISYADPDYLNGTNSGVTIGLGSYGIQPGSFGVFTLRVNNIRHVMFKYNQDGDKNYASVRFMPNYFGSQYVTGATNLQVTFHLPPGIQPEEPRWEQMASNWTGNTEPVTGFDDNDRVTYSWSSSSASSAKDYKFAAAFPTSYVPVEEVYNPTLVTFDPTMLICPCMGLFFLAIAGFSVYSAIWGSKKRKMQYLPPRISIEGHGIKRGLTAAEAAILMEQPMDKVLTMILFGVIKKSAATVKTREPLEVEIPANLPEGLQPYETEFLAAFKIAGIKERQRAMQEVIVGMVKSVTEKMKGFSRKETIAYYDGINKRAWAQVEAAGTPEIKSQKFDENLEWTMLDKDYDGHVKQTFSQGPVFLPVWWGHFDPTYRGSTAVSRPITSIGTGKPSISTPSQPITVSMPSLPGSSFASSMVTGIQSFASGVVGDITSFTSGITNRTNPPPPPTVSSSRGGGSSGGRSCACACACAGCACACAGGGR